MTPSSIPAETTPSELTQKKFSDMDDREFAAFSMGYRTALRPTLEKDPGFHLVKYCESPLTPTQWIVKGLIERDSLGLVFGDPSSGKTFFALDLAASIATGTDFHGHQVKAKGPVCYIAGEGHSGLKRRLRAWDVRHGLKLKGAPLFISTTAMVLCDGNSVRAVDASISKLVEGSGPPVLVIVDTWSRNLGADENSSLDGAAAIRALDQLRARWQCAVLIVHHAGHTEKTRARGWSGLRAAVDTEFSIERGPDGIIRLRNTKTKDGSVPDPLSFTLRAEEIGLVDDEGQPVTSAFLERVDWTPPKETKGRPPTVRDKARKILDRLYEEHRNNVQRSGRDPCLAMVSLKDWQGACLAEGIPRQRFSDAKRALLDQGEILFEDPYVKLSGLLSGNTVSYRHGIISGHGQSSGKQFPDISGQTDKVYGKQYEDKVYEKQNTGKDLSGHFRTMPSGNNNLPACPESISGEKPLDEELEIY